MSFSSNFQLFWIRIKTDLWNGLEYLKVIFLYYRNRRFARADWYLVRAYLTENPYRISKEFLKKRGERVVNTYGETPLTSMDLIAQECGITKEDVVYEVGCGRGRTCFWLNAFVGCSVYGIEYIPAFVRIAQSVKRRYHIEGVHFYCQDLLNADFTKATVIYFYGTCADERLLYAFIEKLLHLKQKVKVITISFSLAEYTPFFQTVKQFKVRFPWGETDAYVHLISDEYLYAAAADDTC